MIVDTNIIIACLNGEQPVVDLLVNWRRKGRFLYLPTVVEAEVLSYSDWSDKEYKLAVEFMEENFISMAFTRSIARIAGDIRRSTNIKLPDAAIAATALHAKTPLMTRNIRDFKKVKNLQLVEV